MITGVVMSVCIGILWGGVGVNAASMNSGDIVPYYFINALVFTVISWTL